MKKNIAVIRGDGIGPEIVDQALLVLDKIAEIFGHEFTYTDVAMGGNAIDAYGDPLPQSELDKCIASDSVLLGAVGVPKWNDVPGPMRPEKGLLRLRAGMGVYSNNRPARIWPQLAAASPLKESIVQKGIDFIIVRELIGGIYDHRQLVGGGAVHEVGADQVLGGQARGLRHEGALAHAKAHVAAAEDLDAAHTVSIHQNIRQFCVDHGINMRLFEHLVDHDAHPRDVHIGQ